MTKNLIVNGRLHEICKTYEGKKLCVGKGVHELLEYKVEDLIRNACKRATKNGRTTILDRDL